MLMGNNCCTWLNILGLFHVCAACKRVTAERVVVEILRNSGLWVVCGWTCVLFGVSGCVYVYANN